MSTAPVCPSCGPHVDGTLHRLRTRTGLSAAAWLWAPAAGAEGHLFVGDGEVVVHTGTSSPLRVRADAGALPVPSRSVPALVVAPVLAQRADLDGVFAEMRRVLRPSGLLTLLVPDGPSLGLRGRGLRSDVRALWAHRSAVDHPDWLLTAADFAVMGDDRLGFTDPGVRDSGEGSRHVDALRTAALLPPQLTDDVGRRLADHPTMRAGRATVRRLVARR